MSSKNKKNFIDEYYRAEDTVEGLRIHKIIGEGRYGIVYLAENDGNQKYIIKQLKKEMLKHSRKSLFFEETILRSLDYPCFPKFISKFKDNTCEGFIMEYIEGTVMEDLLVDMRYEFSKSDIYKIAGQLLEIIEILHNHNIAHLDIRLPNVIRRNDQNLVLIDFGLAEYIDNDKGAIETDYWYLGDFLIHLYYSSYKDNKETERPWFEELDLNPEELIFLKKLMGIERRFKNIGEIKKQLEVIINTDSYKEM